MFAIKRHNFSGALPPILTPKSKILGTPGPLLFLKEKKQKNFNAKHRKAVFWE
jgi:hypothetical protein